MDTTTSQGFGTLLDEAYKQLHEFVVSPGANEGRSIVLEDHLRDSLTRVMSPVSGNIEWVSPEYVELWLQREAQYAPSIESTNIVLQNTDIKSSEDESLENSVKIQKLEEEISSLRKAVDNVIRVNEHKKLRTSRELQSYDINSSTSSGLQQVQRQIQRTKVNGTPESGIGQLDSEYINLLERSLVETQEQVFVQ